MQPYEQLGLFYLGRRYDLASRSRTQEPVLYDSRDLVTHAVCVGMTGSGKTGLGITLIEEAALDGIPVLAIDPKGDLANLALTFPNLAASDFASWVPTGTTADAQARAWASGLAEWEQDGDRIARLRGASDVRIYTPGSGAATPLALLKSLTAAASDSDPEAESARIGGVADALLALAGLTDSGPHRRERTFIAALLERASQQGTAVDLAWLVQQVQRPSIERVGVLDVETFYPASERQDLALRLNSVIASPGFDVWLSGEPMEMANLLYTAAGKPRIAIVSIAHLGDAERMLVVSLLLNELLLWTRKQAGTTALRAMLYMDEVAGYVPPVANPASKAPLLTLMKQARAFGVGVVLATQNPVDLDYKSLSNAGTWFLGKLQTDRDKARVLDGLEGAAAGSLDRAALDTALSSLRSRVFLLHNVHESAPVVFETRWTLSYLRGPMTKEELRRLAPSSTTPAAQPPAPPRTATRPVVPAGVREYFAAGAATAYEPVLYGSARVAYVDSKRKVDTSVEVHATAPFSQGAVPIDWSHATETDMAPDALLSASPSAGAAYADLPSAATEPRNYAEWTRDFERWIAQSRPLRVFSAPRLGLVSHPGESERDFRVRVQHARHEQRDAEVERLRARFAPKQARLGERVAKAQDTAARERQQSQQQQVQNAVSIGATLVGAFLGRRALSASTLGRATTAARGVSRANKEADDVRRAEGRVVELQQEVAALEAELQREIAALAQSGDEPIDVVEIKPKRGAVDVRLVALTWVPSAP